MTDRFDLRPGLRERTARPGLPGQRFPAAVDVRAGVGDDLAIAVTGVDLLLLAPAARRARDECQGKD